MRDNVLNIEAVLSDGSLYNFGQIDVNNPVKNSPNKFAENIITNLIKLANKNKKEILDKIS